MAFLDETLTDRWMRKAKNHPLFAIAAVIGAIIGVGTPVYLLANNILTTGISGLTSDQATYILRDRDEILVPARELLHENKALYDLLSSDLYKEPGWGVQESYYIRVQRDGAEKHDLMRKQIDSLVENNKKIIEKLENYVGRARSKKFIEQHSLFRRHAKLYEARWSGMKAAAISGELQPVAEPAFPPNFPSSLEAEIKKVRSIISEHNLN